MKCNIGDKFGRLTVLEKTSLRNMAQATCMCECGNKITVYSANLIRGKTRSCGCLYKESRLLINKTHGETHDRLYGIWTNMKTRCYNEKASEWKYYGGKQISVCPEWKESYENFAKWAKSNGYDEKLTIDRKEGDKNYTPSNCRWADYYTQNQNKSDNINITIDNETKCLKQWCVKFNLKYKLVHQKMKRSNCNAEKTLQWYINKQKGDM